MTRLLVLCGLLAACAGPPKGPAGASCTVDCDCELALTCVSGTCAISRSCEPGARRCFGRRGQVCDDDGRVFVDSTPECAFGCDDGRCLERLCEPGTTRCFGVTHATCNANGYGWDATEGDCP